MMTTRRFRKISLFSALSLSGMQRYVVPNLKPKRLCSVCPFMLAEAEPVKELRTT